MPDAQRALSENPFSRLRTLRQCSYCTRLTWVGEEGDPCLMPVDPGSGYKRCPGKYKKYEGHLVPKEKETP